MSKREIKFRPLRLVKKTGKITVASYMQWRKVKTADYNEFNLMIDEEYKTFPKEALVYDHNGDNLFWRNFNPNDIKLLGEYDLKDGERPSYPEMWRTHYDMYCARGLDCDGVPTFSHGTAHNLTIGNMYNYTLEEVGEVLNPMSEYELLTVEIVTWWFGWFLYNLKNSNLKTAK